MTQVKQHTFSCIALVLLLAVLLPSVVKLGHVFEDHKHEVCKGEKAAHIHEIDSDCEFYKFHLNTEFHITNTTLVFDFSEFNYKTISSNYGFKNCDNTSGISLRGPPLT